MKSKVTREDVFLGSEAPLPSGFPQPLTPTSREISRHAFHHGGVDFFGIAICFFGYRERIWQEHSFLTISLKKE